jgi:hypothetical protein
MGSCSGFRIFVSEFCSTLLWPSFVLHV